MKVDKLSISLDSDLGRQVRRAAESSGKGLSGWLAEAAAAKLRSEALARIVETWNHKSGPVKASDLAIAEKYLGLDQRKEAD